jgi:SpoVK/Ycf46/Vps4 family AAA+-type ATPase
MANQFLEIPDSFWSLFRSKNRQIYINALLQINEEYQYSDYFLSREICIQTLSDYFAKQRVVLEQDELEEDVDVLEPLATRVLNWLLRAGWLRKVDDYNTMAVNIVIPDYAAVFVDAFVHLAGEDEDETQVYIQNIYAVLFAFKNDPRSNIALLKTALINTRKLNKTLQDMLQNMDKFFASLLDQRNYVNLLKEHLEGYVEEIVRKKYHILKTSDNFYLYKLDIKRGLTQMRQDLPWLEGVCQKNKQLRGLDIQVDELVEQLDMIERGFDDIEHRIMNLDKEHTKYIRATVTRLNYLLNKEDNMKGLVIDLLNHLSELDEESRDDDLAKIANLINLSQMTVISEKSLYKRRRPKQDFVESLADEEVQEELSRDEILKLNKIKNRYSRKQIEEFVMEHMKDGKMEVTEQTVTSQEDFEKLVLAYDFSIRKDSSYDVKTQDAEMIDNGCYRYPGLVFEIKKK